MKNLLILALLSTLTLSAKSKTETIGDVMLGLIPLTAYGAPLYLDDKEGEMQFYKTAGTTIASTYLLKYSVKEERPDHSDEESFPSGHTSMTFASATFIHKRYGLNYAIPAYLGSIYTGYSRIHSNKHHTHDVLAGAMLGMASSWYFTTSYKEVQVQPVVSSDYNGVMLSYRW
ncbi:phosphatase PAP2 family protein [bacterium]|nr:phosphatase PAP2 family protein [bacterium]MBU1957710.1 phosphatase PAP2 family protein [bacterium]